MKSAAAELFSLTEEPNPQKTLALSMWKRPPECME